MGPYLLESHSQLFAHSPFFRDIEPSPIEALSHGLTAALLSIGINHDYLREPVLQKLSTYLRSCADAAGSSATLSLDGSDAGSSSEVDEAIHIATIAISLLGFLNAAATYANFWIFSERLELIVKVKSILSESFLVSIETAFSTIRNSSISQNKVREWRRYIRHYASIGRPLGAMLLQQNLMWLLVASSSLLVTVVERLRTDDVLDVLMSGDGFTRSEDSKALSALELMANTAEEEMSLLEDGADYLRLGSAWQQSLAFSVKAATLTTFLNCALVNEDAADPDTLMAWLEDTLADAIQMADETLATVVLRCLALVSKFSTSFAVNVSRLLPRFLVQGSPRGRILSTTSACLAYVLKNLSQDATISTLYTLGNVLSTSSSAPERALTGTLNGSINGMNSGGVYGGRHSTGSSISLAISGEEETSLVYGNVVQAICDLARSSNDPKITALAQSMLLQKIDRVSKTIDSCIITEAASLALNGGQLEFRSLLKLYSKLSNDAVLQKNEPLSVAVGHLLHLKSRVLMLHLKSRVLMSI